MPQRINIVGDLGTTKVASDSYDIDNIYFTQEGWVYRHYKRSDKSKWWDEIIVAGEVKLPTAQGGPADGSGNDNDKVIATNPAKLGLAGGIDADGNVVADPVFEGKPGGLDVGDGYSDYLYSPNYDSTTTPIGPGSLAEGGGVPDFNQDGTPGGEDPADEGGDSGNSNGQTPAQPIVP